ncbi:MAG: RidA family protein [Steroidobacteraceae bacterium]
MSGSLQPEGWPRPSGYSNGVLAQGHQVFIAGQVGWNPRSGKFESASLVDQAAQALKNVLAVLAQANGRPEHIARITWYLTSRAEYLAHLKEIGAAYRDVMGNHFPAMTAVEVTALIEAQAKVEIEATAVIP